MQSFCTVRFVSRFWTKVSKSNLCVKINVVNNTPFFCNKMDKKSPKVILLLHNNEPFLFGCQLKKSPKVILHLHNSEPLLSSCQLISSPALSLKFFSIQSVNFRTWLPTSLLLLYLFGNMCVIFWSYFGIKILINVFWEQYIYKVLDLERPIHGDNLHACVIDFNSCNL